MEETAVHLVSISEACKRLGIGERRVYKLINKKAVKLVKIGNRRLISIKFLNEFVESLENEI